MIKGFEKKNGLNRGKERKGLKVACREGLRGREWKSKENKGKMKLHEKIKKIFVGLETRVFCYFFH